MVGTIIDYLKEYGDCSFAEEPFGDVDSLILCQLAYLKFDGFVPDVRKYEPWVALQELTERDDFYKLFQNDLFEKSNRALVKGMLSGRRFRNLKMNCYVNLVEKDWETQFSAITFMMEDGTLYIAFRGTDETIVGWKEDFNMAFLHPVPSQLYSAKYLNMVAGRLRRPFYVGGHSKGGNLAVYGAMKCVPSARKNIIRVYSMDGPGFRPEVLTEGEWHKLEDKIVKILPHSSLVGMLFEYDMNYQVVESKSFGVAQHNPYSWLVSNNDFVRVKDVYGSRKRSNNTLNEWILSLDENHLRVFVDTLYQVVTASEAEDILQFTANLTTSLNKVMAAIRDMDDQTVRMLKETVKSLFEIAGEHMREEFTPRRSFSGKRRKRFAPEKKKESEEERLILESAQS